LGAVLSDPVTQAGADVIRQMLLNRKWTLPIGLVVPPSYQIKFRHKDPDDFGRRLDLLCHFYESGNCAIWKYRNSECSTYFCVYDEGEIGPKKWSAISDQLFAEEMNFSQEAMLNFGFHWPEVEENLKFVLYLSDTIPSDEEGYILSVSRWQYFWRHWTDRPDQYYRSCWDFVQDFK